MAVYHVPVRLHGRRARTKAAIAFTLRRDDTTVPAPGTRIVTVEADTHEEAYRKLCAAVLPGDGRTIMCKRAIRFLRDRAGHAGYVDHPSRALIAADYLEERCDMPDAAESIRLMVRDATAHLRA